MEILEFFRELLEGCIKILSSCWFVNWSVLRYFSVNWFEAGGCGGMRILAGDEEEPAMPGGEPWPLLNMGS